MYLKIRLFLFLCSSALLASSVVAADRVESLYNPKTAQKLDVSKLSFFGPKAGKFRYDQRMIHASEIAAARAHRHSTYRCWGYVKDALVASKIIDTRPKSEFAKDAALELTATYGFKLLREDNPYNAPIGSVLVYGGRGAGHVEFRTPFGFVSDFVSIKPSPRPLIGIYVKPV